MDNTQFEGKKVFFVYPHSVFQENLIQRLVDLEYEIYILKDHKHVDTVLQLFPDAVMFFNIDRGMNRDEWEKFIRGLLQEPRKEPLSLGILSYEFQKELAQLYLFELSLPCGYIQLKQSLDEATRIVAKTLEANEVKRRRKFIRYRVDENTELKFNARVGSQLEDGQVLDISSAGIAAVFNRQDLVLTKNSLLSDIQLNLMGKRVRVSGVVLGFRDQAENSRPVNVILFDQRVDGDTKGVIRKFVNHKLQAILERKLGME